MGVLDQEHYDSNQKRVVRKLREYGAAIKGDRIVQALLFEVMCKATDAFPTSTAVNIVKRDIHGITIMWELKQDRTRYRHLSPLGQGLLELVPAFMTPAPIDVHMDTDDYGAQVTRIGKVVDPYGDLRNGKGVPADQFGNNSVAVHVEEGFNLNIQQPDSFVAAGGWTAPAASVYDDILKRSIDADGNANISNEDYELMKKVQSDLRGGIAQSIDGDILNGPVALPEKTLEDRLREGTITLNQARRMLGYPPSSSEVNEHNIVGNSVVFPVGHKAGKNRRAMENVTLNEAMKALSEEVVPQVGAFSKIRRMFQ